MSRGSWAAIAATGLFAHALLLAGAPGVPGPARLALAFAALVLLPGFAFVALGGTPPGGLPLAAGWALGFGVAWNSALVLVAKVLGQPIGVLDLPSFLAAAALWAVVLCRPRPRPPAPAETPLRWPAPALWAVVLAASVGAWHAARLGAPLNYSTDSPDHIATVRRIVETGEPFPVDAYFKDAGEAGRDPRKGVWHPQVARIAKLARVDPLDAWRLLPALLVPLFVVNAACFGVLAGGVAGAAVAAWGLLLTYSGSLAEPYLREAVYATKLADQLALATLTAVVADLIRPQWSARLAAVGLGLGAVTAHVFAAIQFFVVFGALGIGLLLAERGWSARARRLAGTAGLVGVAAVPYVAWRALASYAPVNLIHTEPQGMLVLPGGGRIVPIGGLWDWLGWAWVLFAFAAPGLWRAARSSPVALVLLTTPLAFAAIAFNPLAVALLEPRLGYLLARFVWMLPLTGLLAWLVPRLWDEAKIPPRRRRALLGLAGIAVLLLPALSDAALVLSQPGRFADAERRVSYRRWEDALTWMDAHLPAGSIVLSDPTTSYSVPMMTRHYVATLVDQHSSPSDPHALRRILDARDALDPYAGWERTREVVRAYGVDAIALNDRFATPPSQHYWATEPEWFGPARARLDAAPDAFERVFDTGDFVVYRIRRSALDTLSGPPMPRPFVRPFVSGRAPIARRMGDGLPVLHMARVGPAVAAPGETLLGIADWRALEPLRAGSYSVSVRFDREDLPGGFRPPATIAKPARKLLEAVRGERYRFRGDHQPARGAYGVDLWRPDEIVRDSFEVVIPGDIAEGIYTVQVRMISQPIYPNYRLSDYARDDDYYAGLPVGSLLVARDAPAQRREAARRFQESRREPREVHGVHPGGASRSPSSGH